MKNKENKVLEQKESKKDTRKDSINDEEKMMELKVKKRAATNLKSERFRNIKSADVTGIMAFETKIIDIFHEVIETTFGDKIDIDELSVHHKLDKKIIAELKNIILSKGSSRNYIIDILHGLIKKYRLKITGDHEGIKKYGDEQKRALKTNAKMLNRQGLLTNKARKLHGNKLNLDEQRMNRLRLRREKSTRPISGKRNKLSKKLKKR